MSNSIILYNCDAVTNTFRFDPRPSRDPNIYATYLLRAAYHYRPGILRNAYQCCSHPPELKPLPVKWHRPSLAPVKNVLRRIRFIQKELDVFPPLANVPRRSPLLIPTHAHPSPALTCCTMPLLFRANHYSSLDANATSPRSNSSPRRSPRVWSPKMLYSKPRGHVDWFKWPSG
ncbi:hypothetical protein RSAG8_07577, partial [Rhizoctonia solani AG-8 WAC10335]